MKRFLFSVLVSTFFFISSFAADISEREKSIQSHLEQRTGSFRRIILSAVGQNLIHELSDRHPGCGEAVREVYATGGSLYSRRLDAAATRLGDVPFASGVQDNIFYHYTQNKSFMKSLDESAEEIQKNQAYEKIFIYLRAHQKPGTSYGNWSRIFYMSEDPDTIRNFAPFCVEFKMNMEARVVELESKLFSSAIREVGDRHPEVLDKCGSEMDQSGRDTYSTVYWNSLNFLMAEDSGLDAIDYQFHHWFQILNPDMILSSRALGRVGGNARAASQSPEVDDPEKIYAEVNKPIISVVSVVYGLSSTEKPTQNAKDYLEGKTFAHYKISSKFLGNPEPRDNKDFKITWKCISAGDLQHPVGPEKTISVPGTESEGKIIEISCE